MKNKIPKKKFFTRGGLLNVYVVFRGGLPNVYVYLQGGRVKNGQNLVYVIKVWPQRKKILCEKILFLLLLLFKKKTYEMIAKHEPALERDQSSTTLFNVIT